MEPKYLPSLIPSTALQGTCLGGLSGADLGKLWGIELNNLISDPDGARVGFSTWITTAGYEDNPQWMASTEVTSTEGIQKIIACMMIANLPAVAIPELLDDLRITLDYYQEYSNSEFAGVVTSQKATSLRIDDLRTAEPVLRIPA